MIRVRQAEVKDLGVAVEALTGKMALNPERSEELASKSPQGFAKQPS